MVPLMANGPLPFCFLLSSLKRMLSGPFAPKKKQLYIYSTPQAHKKEQIKSKIQKDIKDITGSNATSSHFRFKLSAYHLLKVTLFSSLSYLYRDTYNLVAIQ